MKTDADAFQAAGESASLPDLLAGRYTCRAFRETQVARSTIEQILQIARLTPSWCNTQPWHLTITEGAATRRFADALYAHASQFDRTGNPDFTFPQRYSGVYDTRRRHVGSQLYDSIGIERGDRAAAQRQRLENFRMFGAPHVAIVTTDRELGVYGAVDCGAFVNNFLLAAHSLGVATAPQASLAAFPDFIRDHFGLAEDRLLVCALSFGYSEQDKAINSFRTDRAEIAAFAEFKSV